MGQPQDVPLRLAVADEVDRVSHGIDSPVRFGSLVVQDAACLTDGGASLCCPRRKDLAGRPVARILTSDLVRAVETAKVVGKALRAPVALDTRLREQHLGELEGRGYDETWAAAEAHDWSDPTLPLAGGESIMEVHDRLGAVLTEVAELHGGVTVLVSHGDAIRAAVAHLTGVAPHEAPWVEVTNGAVARVDGPITWLG